ncbi:MAG: cytochrome c3 family protein [Candidatus Rokubacteria bacterium]|nr:cytochrome c3 family protein [Candidatus Rokubacteria bacterium]
MRWVGGVGLLALGVLAWGMLGLVVEPAVRQPIEFPHKTHVALDLQCTSCHDQAETDAVAGRPPTEFCLTCHQGGDGKAEEKKIQAFAESGREIPWRRVWRLPAHVFFSHQTHVAVAKVTCQTCHGPMETLDRPPARPLKKLTMSDCIGCHETRQRGAGTAVQAVRAAERRPSTDCNACHR